MIARDAGLTPGPGLEVYDNDGPEGRLRRPGKRRAATQAGALGLGLQRLRLNEGQVSVHSEMAGLNHADLLMIKGYFKEVDFLSLLSDSNRRRLVAGAKHTAYRAGEVLHYAGGPQSAAIVEHGLIRIFWTDPDGRQATVAFMSSGELVGGTTLMGGQWAGASVQAVVDTTLLALDVETARRAASTEIDVCAAVATHLAAQVKNLSATIAVRSIGNISQRLAFDILERACRSQLENGRLEATATHSDLADSIGSSREVVSRALKHLRFARIVETVPGVVRVNDPGRMARIVRGFEFQATHSVA